MISIFGLLKNKTFLPFFLTQFFGALNDNVFKLSMLTLISYHISSSQSQSEHYQAIAGVLFILPFFLFSATAGQMADKYKKSTLTILIKLMEVGLMIVGGIAFYYHQVFLMFLILTGLGIHSAFFGPIKYAILPELLNQKELLNGNSLVEAGTFLAILIGTTLGSLSVSNYQANGHVAIILTNLIALFGFGSCLFMPRTTPKDPNLTLDLNVWRATVQLIKSSLVNLRILICIIAISWFWLIGAVMLTKLPDYTHYILKANASVFAVFLALFSIGIALGSIAIALWLKGQITVRYVPISILLLSIFSFDLFLATPATVGLESKSLIQFFSQFNNIRITLDFFLFSFSSGLFIVPLYTYIQAASDSNIRARIIAVNNIYNALFMALGSALIMILLYFNVSIPHVFCTLAILNAVVAFSLWFIFHVIELDKHCNHSRS